jgi:hypothetical protein
MINFTEEGISALSAQDVADLLKKSKSWVYDHADELGASRIGGSPIFTVEGLKNALSGSRRYISGSGQDKPKKDRPEKRLQIIQGRTRLGGRGEGTASEENRAKELGIIIPDH